MGEVQRSAEKCREVTEMKGIVQRRKIEGRGRSENIT
jgi:hypothetical protein